MFRLQFVRTATALLLVGALGSFHSTCFAQSELGESLAERKEDAETYFRKRVTPFLKTYCLECHQNKRPTEAGLSFTPALRTPGHAAFSEEWKKAAARVHAVDMPPEGCEQPSDEERQMFVQWLDRVKYLSPRDPGTFVIRRLTKTEYGNTLRDLLGVDASLADGLPDEVSGEGYLNSLSPLQLEQYLSIANEALEQVVASDEGEPTSTLQRQLRGDLTPPTKNARKDAGEIARGLAKKAYRRPPTDHEIQVLLEVYDLGRKSELSHANSLRLMLKAMLVSPQFLFITPVDISLAEKQESQSQIVALDDYQLASRLSYFLWSTMPDDELMALADAGTLQDPEELETQVKRMLEDPRSRALFDGFGAQWLGVRDLKNKSFDPSQFPGMNDATCQAMYDEARLFFESLLRGNHSIARFIDSDYTFMNEENALLYGQSDSVAGSEMRKVSLTDPNRGGLLGMPAVLAATSLPNRTSPVKRGVWVLEQILGEHVPAAPPNVPALEKQDQQSVVGLTLRERFEMHRSDTVCANCHRLLDPIGFGLENFDAIGRWREQDDNGQPIDATGELPGGQSFSSPQELKAMIAGRLDDFSRNFVEKLLAYALCRKLEGYDEIVVDELMQNVVRDEYRMQTVISAVVTSYPFTHRRLE